jgi:hypothetical protein
MKRNTDQGNPTEGWRLEPTTGLRAVAIDGEGWWRGILTLARDPDPAGPMFEIRHIEEMNRQPFDERPQPTELVEWFAWNNELIAHTRPITGAFPFDWALAEVNTKQKVAEILALSGQPVDAPPKMLLPMMRDASGKPTASGKRPDAFYQRLATYVAYCTEHGIAFGPRLAEDNNVTTTTVHGWVREARRRGLMEVGR